MTDEIDLIRIRAQARRRKAEAEKEQPELERRLSGVSQDDLFAGSKQGRLESGIADLPLGIYQAGANTGDALYGGAVNLGKAIGAIDEDFQRSSHSKDVNEWMQERQRSKERGMRALGTDGVDWMGMGGNVLSGGALLKGFGMGSNLWQKLLRGAGIGAGFGAASPVNSGDENYAENKAMQTVGGGIGGAALAPLTAGGGKLGGWLYDRYRPLFESGTKTAGRAIRETIGPDKVDAVIKALRADVNPLTQGSAGEVASGTGSTKFAALSRAADDMMPDEALARQLMHNKQQLGVVDDIADLKIRGVEPEDFRNQITTPMRENALNRANENTAKVLKYGKRVDQLDDASGYSPMPAPMVGGTGQAGTNVGTVPNSVRNVAGLEAEKQLANTRAGNRSTPWGAKIPKRYAEDQNLLEKIPGDIADAKLVSSLLKSEKSMVERQLESMAAHGIKPSSPNLIVSGIEASMNKPAVMGNPILKRILQKASNDIGRMVSKDGTISPQALYAYRKTGLNHTIEQYMKNSDPNVKGSVVNELSGQIKPLIDDVIETASGGGWKAYLKAYSKLSRLVEQKLIGQELRKKFAPALKSKDPKAAQLATALEESERTVRQSGVRSGKAMGKILNRKQQKSYDTLMDDLERSDLTDKMATSGRQAMATSMKPDDLTLSNFLMREIMVANAAIRRLSGSSMEAAEKEVARLFQRDPQTAYKALADAIEQSAPAQRSKLAKIMTQYFPEAAAKGLPAAAGLMAGEAGGS